MRALNYQNIADCQVIKSIELYKMNLLPQEIIRKKRLGQVLTQDDIKCFFGGFLKGQVADYQVSAMLMAIVFRGMEPEETARLTMFMRDSGEVLSWDHVAKDQVVDKHSTGGIGDKTSLILLPLCILEGITVPMIAGRGLGHTGGTLDKLESIPGMNVYLSPDDLKRLLRKNHGVFMGQTSHVAPLDKRLYAMRDVTDTVESIPLITASILSKKLSEGIGGLVMDVKFGSGAFMQRKEDALNLAQSISNVGRASGIQICCMLTDMGSPLGSFAGNALEVKECVDVLKGKGPDSTIHLTIELALEMVRLSQKDVDEDALRKRFLKHLSSGRAYELFCKIVHDQGGDTSVLDDPKKLVTSRYQIPVPSAETGFVETIDCRALGLSIIDLGGGRLRSSDTIDHAVGFSDLKRCGDSVTKGEPLAIVHCQNEQIGRRVVENVLKSYTVGLKQCAEPLVWQKF